MVISLRLYVCGESPLSLVARANLESLLRGMDASAVRLEIVDVLEEPLRAILDAVPVTPMVVRIAPAPALRIVGDLSERETVLRLLRLDPAKP